MVKAPLCLLAVLLVLVGCGSGASTRSAPPEDSGPVAGKLSIRELRIDSRAVGRELDVSVIDPTEASATRRPLLVFLHGAGGSNESFLANRVVLSSLIRLGAEAPVVAFPDGETSWWHDRDSGEWERYVTREVIPTVRRRFDTDPQRVAVGGISMGGYGAYHLGLEHPGRFCAVGGHSAGLWLDESEEFEGAFDNRSDYERNDVLAAVRADPEAFGDTRIWNDYGDEDWFVAGNAAFVSALRGGGADLTAHVWPGGHDSAYWDAHWPTYLQFYADALAAC
ncbi:MAG TPA: alpha/beta hydrolase-fold protein [Solirubrobacterales bacterium]